MNYYMKRPEFNWSGPVAYWLAIPTRSKEDARDKSAHQPDV